MSGGGTKLPQLYALQLERMIAHGLSANKIMDLLRAGAESEAELTEAVDPNVKWERLLTFAQDNLQLMESAVSDGYRFPFITIGGIKNLLAIKYRKREGADYRFPGDRIEGLRLNGAELELLRSMIPTYWVFTRGDSQLGEDRHEITIALQRP